MGPSGAGKSKVRCLLVILSAFICFFYLLHDSSLITSCGKTKRKCSSVMEQPAVPLCSNQPQSSWIPPLSRTTWLLCLIPQGSIIHMLQMLTLFEMWPNGYKFRKLVCFDSLPVYFVLTFRIYKVITRKRSLEALSISMTYRANGFRVSPFKTSKKLSACVETLVAVRSSLA